MANLINPNIAGRARWNIARRFIHGDPTENKGIAQKCRADCIILHFYHHPEKKSFRDGDLKRIVESVRVDCNKAGSAFLQGQLHYYDKDHKNQADES